jgi:hypothetical protein
VRARRPGEFDAFLFADYSGAASPSVQRRAIALWRLDRGGRPRKVRRPFTREALRDALLGALVFASSFGGRWRPSSIGGAVPRPALDTRLPRP